MKYNEKVMFGRLKLRYRIYILLAALLAITLSGGLTTIWYAYRTEAIATRVVRGHMAAYEASQDMVNSLVMQKGLVTYYFLNSDENWLKQLDQYRNAFEDGLARARRTAHNDSQREILNRIDIQYHEYNKARDQIIELYREGKRDKGAELHWDVRGQFFAIFDLCNVYKDIHKKEIEIARHSSMITSRRMRAGAVGFLTVALILFVLLSFVLIAQVLQPIRRLTRRAGQEHGGEAGETGVRARDEIHALSSRVDGLIQSVGATRTELERSRNLLLQSEKMATLGKLAAEVAHSIRNPMTSIKMRLFSLQRSLDMSAGQAEDLEVISGELRRLDNILCNFLEFSRPPKLKIQQVNISQIVDMATQLLEKRFEKSSVIVKVRRVREMPLLSGDPELLKEVMLNLFVNACDAMPGGGRLVIEEEEVVADEVGRAVLVRVSDTGCGIPEPMQHQVLEPFVTTKEDGTGLGLSIATRIVHEHGGRIEVMSREGEGAVFSILLPVMEAVS